MKIGHDIPLLLAQFKAYHSLDETLETIKTLITEQAASKLRMHFAVPYSFLDPLTKQLAPEITVGAEMMLNTDEEAFTQTVAGKMLKDAGAKFVLIGDVDERRVYNPNAATISSKIVNALENGIRPIVCIGETLEQFHAEQSREVLQNELFESLGELTFEQLQGLHILYDAPWINRTPWEAASEELHKAYHMVREVLNDLFVEEIADTLRIIYAVPTFSNDLPQLMKALPASGYSLGVMTQTAAELSHLIPLLTYCEEDEPKAPHLTGTEEEVAAKRAKKMPKPRKKKEAAAEGLEGEVKEEKKKVPRPRKPRAKKTE